jgi:multidrug efflux pump subunit AcrB
MSGIISGLEKFFTKDRIMIFVVFGILVVFLMWYSGNKSTFMDNMDTPYAPVSGYETSSTPSNYEQEDFSIIPSETKEKKYPSVSSVATSSGTGVVQPAANNGYSSQYINNSEDLLPKDDNNEWESLNPITNSQGGANVPDLLQAGYHIGLDTIGQTMKNANLQLRSDPIIPKTVVGPWNQSTLEPDVMRVPLEVGYYSQ